MNDAVGKAAQEILEIGLELKKLQGAVHQHAEAAAALTAASDCMTKLSSVLSLLPDSLNQSVQRAESAVSLTERAMQPAGDLVTAVAALPSTEVLKQSVASMTTEVSTHLRKVAEDSSSKLIDLARRLEQLEQGTRAALEGVASQNKVTFSALQQLKKEFEESDKQSRDKLVVLERLARRSLFAILMGRDPDQNK